MHQAQLIPEWGNVTFFTNEVLTLDREARDDLTARGVTIEETPSARLSGDADVIVKDGQQLSSAEIFTAPRNALQRPSQSHWAVRSQKSRWGCRYRRMK